MRLKNYQKKEKGKRVWLDQSELAALFGTVDDPEKRLAFYLAGRVGLRAGEIVQIKRADFVEGPTGQHLRVWDDVAKKGHYREPPVPDRVEELANARAHAVGDGEPLVERDKSTIYRWVQKSAGQLLDDTGDEGWRFVGPHDLRRTWGTDLLEQGVLPSVVMEWGGWRDWDTFRKHYLGEFSPEAIKRERRKVEYLDGTAENRESTGQARQGYSAAPVSGGKPPG